MGKYAWCTMVLLLLDDGNDFPLLPLEDGSWPRRYRSLMEWEDEDGAPRRCPRRRPSWNTPSKANSIASPTLATRPWPEDGCLLADSVSPTPLAFPARAVLRHCIALSIRSWIVRSSPKALRTAFQCLLDFDVATFSPPAAIGAYFPRIEPPSPLDDDAHDHPAEVREEDSHDHPESMDAPDDDGLLLLAAAAGGRCWLRAEPEERAV